MKRGSLVAAVTVVLVANAFALVHAWRNRSGPVEADITLTERELNQSYGWTDKEDSGVGFNLRWIDPQWEWQGDSVRWLDQKILRELGFDTSVAASDKSASEFYARQRARRAFVALEYDGPGWRKWADDLERESQGQTPAPAYQALRRQALATQREASTRLVAIDASSDAAKLRARHPDRGVVIIVPAVIRISAGPLSAKKPPELCGAIQEIPSSIHVPLPFSDAFRRQRGKGNNAKYRVRLRYGAMLEPWIAGVEFAPAPGR